MSDDRTSGATAIVLARGINGLGVVRSLDAAGWRAIVIAPSANELAMLSRLPVQKHLVPMGTRWDAELLQLLERLDCEGRPPLLPCFDSAAEFLVKHRSALERKFSVLAPDEDITRKLNDKHHELEMIERMGIALPKSVTRLETLQSDAQLNEFSYPVIVKPRTQDGMAIINAKNIILHNAEQLSAFLARYRARLSQFVLQEVVPGGDAALWLCSAAFDRHSNLLAAFTYQRLGAMPVNCGVTSIGISNFNEQVVARCAEVGRALNYVGPADVEFMLDSRTGELVYIEINPRIGMCNWFDTQCGVNVVEASCLAATGAPPIQYGPQRTDVIFWNVLGDLTARLEVRQNPLTALRLYSRLVFKTKVWPIHSWADPYPALVASKNGIANMMVRFARFLRARWRELSPRIPIPPRGRYFLLFVMVFVAAE